MERLKGIGVSPGVAVGPALVAIQQLVASGAIERQQSVVLFNTGGALKYLDVLSS